MKLEDYREQLRKNPEYIQAERELQIKLEMAYAIIRARVKKGITQTQLVREVGTKQANISRIESSLANPTIDLVQRILNVLDLEIIIKPEFQTTFRETPSLKPSTESILVEDWPGIDCNIPYQININALSNSEGPND